MTPMGYDGIMTKKRDVFKNRFGFELDNKHVHLTQGELHPFSAIWKNIFVKQRNILMKPRNILSNQRERKKNKSVFNWSHTLPQLILKC